MALIAYAVAPETDLDAFAREVLDTSGAGADHGPAERPPPPQ